MAYQYAIMDAQDTDQITISMWFFTLGGSDGPLFQVGPQPPVVAMTIDIGNDGIGGAGAQSSVSTVGTFLHGTSSPASIPPTGGGGPLFDGDHPGPYLPYGAIGGGYGVEGSATPMDFSCPDPSQTWTPNAGGGTAWSIGDLVYDSGLVSLGAGFYKAVGLFSMTGGSKMPQQPSGLGLFGAAPFFVASSRIGGVISGSPLAVITAPNQKVLRPNTFAPTGTWNHIFINWDGSESGYSIVMNNLDVSDHSHDHFPGIGGWVHGTDKMAVNGLRAGLPIVPDQDGPFCQNGSQFGPSGPWRSGFGPNILMRYAYVQVWFGRSIDPGDFSAFFTVTDNGLIPPANPLAAQNAYGPSDIFFYRDKTKGKSWRNYGTAGDFTGVGTPPTDYTPGPGQTSTQLQLGGVRGLWGPLSKSDREDLVRRGALLGVG